MCTYMYVYMRRHVCAYTFAHTYIQTHTKDTHKLYLNHPMA